MQAAISQMNESGNRVGAIKVGEGFCRGDGMRMAARQKLDCRETHIQRNEASGGERETVAD
jgi:hypothetical protein